MRCRYSISPPGLVCISNKPDFNDAGFGIQGSDLIFSGDKQCKNNSSEVCENTIKEGPIPSGCCRIIPHESKPDFWRLIPVNWTKFDSLLYRLGMARSGFMLHPGSVSWGCITVTTTAMEQYKAIAALFFTVMLQREASLGAGYVAFNSGDYVEARDRLSLLAELGDKSARQLMAYMSGLGLGGPVDIADALGWMQKSAQGSVDERRAVGEQAYYLGRDAVAGLYGADKVEIGRLWLQIADLSGYERIATREAL